jgi:hypothetical protein
LFVSGLLSFFPSLLIDFNFSCASFLRLYISASLILFAGSTIFFMEGFAGGAGFFSLAEALLFIDLFVIG